jgi:hypothetical protein
LRLNADKRPGERVRGGGGFEWRRPNAGLSSLNRLFVRMDVRERERERKRGHFKKIKIKNKDT